MLLQTAMAAPLPALNPDQWISRPVSQVNGAPEESIYQETLPDKQRVLTTPTTPAAPLPALNPDQQGAGMPASQVNGEYGETIYQDETFPDKQHVFAEPMLKKEVQVLRFPRGSQNNDEQGGSSTVKPEHEAFNATIQHMQDINDVPVSLSDIVTRILDRNLKLKRSSLEINVAKAKQLKSFSEFLPSLRFSAVHNYFHGGLQIISNDLRKTTIKTQALQAELYYPLSLGGKQLYDYRGAQAATEASLQELKDAQAGKLMEGLKAYFNLQLAYANKQIALHAAQELDDQLKKVQALYEAGAQPKIGILDTQFLIYRRTVDLQKADKAIRDAQIALAELTNYPPDTRLIPTEDFSDIESLNVIKQGQQPIEAYIAKAVQHYPGLLAAKAKKGVAEQALKSSKANLFPTLELSAYSRLLGNYQNYLPGENAGFTIQWNILDNLGVKAKADLEKQHAVLQQAEIAVEETQLNVIANLQSAYADMEACHQQMTTHFDNLKLVLELYEHAFNRFYEGLGPYTDVNNALVDLNTLRGEYAKASVEYYTNRLMLDLYTGDLSSLIDPGKAAAEPKLKASQ